MSAVVDVVIAGAGPAGVAAALGCARRGLEVALVDRARFPRDKPCGEGLLPSAVRALAELGLYSRIRPHALPLDGIGFAVPDGPLARARFCDAAGAPAQGLGIARRTLDALLVQAAREQAGITLLEGVDVTHPLRDGKRVVGVETSAGAIFARVSIVADGLRSRLRTLLGLDRETPESPRVGLRIHLRVPRLPFGREVRVIVAPQLEYYLTPVATTELEVAVLGARHAFEQLRVAGPTLEQHLRVQPALARVLDGATALDRPLGAGPFRQRVRALVTDGAMLCGDAAGYLDAITGEGIGLALDTGRAAARAAADGVLGGDVSARALSPYARAHAQIVRDAERLTRMVLWLAASPRLARRAIGFLARSPLVFEKLLRVQAGAPLSTVPLYDWARLVTG